MYVRPHQAMLLTTRLDPDLHINITYTLHRADVPPYHARAGVGPHPRGLQHHGGRPLAHLLQRAVRIVFFPYLNMCTHT